MAPVLDAAFGAGHTSGLEHARDFAHGENVVFLSFRRFRNHAETEVPPKVWTKDGEAEKENRLCPRLTKSRSKIYDLEFKKQAVQLLHTSGRPLAQIARELGVETWQLRDWKKRLQPQLASNPRPSKPCACAWHSWSARTSLAPAARHSKKNFGHRLDHVSERYQRIKNMVSDHPLSELCRAFGVSRSDYYAWRERAPSARQEANTRLLEEIQTLRQGEEACYGSPRMIHLSKRRQFQRHPSDRHLCGTFRSDSCDGRMQCHYFQFPPRTDSRRQPPYPEPLDGIEPRR